MNKVLNKRLLRELRSNFARYLALFLLIVLSMYIIIAIVGAAETIITGTEREVKEQKVEEGQFTTFFPLTEEREEDLREEGISLERMFSFDAELADESVLRVFANRASINLISVDEGRLAENVGEAVLEKRYAEEHDLGINEVIRVEDVNFTITGIGSVPEYDMPIAKVSDTAVESTRFGLLFVTGEQYDALKGTANVEDYCYAYHLNDRITHKELKEMLKETEGVILTSFTEAEDNLRILAAAGDVVTNKKVGLLAGMVIMVLFTYVLSVFVVHQIQQESSVIGTLYALGAKKKHLLRHYIILPTAISFLGGLVGAGLGFSDLGIVWQMGDTYCYYSIPELEPMYPLYLILYAVAMPPVVSVLVNYIVIRKRLSGTALSLIRNEQNRTHGSKLKIGKLGFLRRFQVRQMVREARTGLTVVFGLMISLLVLMLGLDCFTLCNNIKIDNSRDVRFEYMYVLKYPAETVPEHAEACYTRPLSRTELGYTLEINVIGIDEDNKYYGAAPVAGKSSVVISSSVAQKYGLKEGDKFILTDKTDDMEYAFTVEGVVEYSVGLSVFMNIDSMRELFGQEEDYYNMLLSDEALSLEEGTVYAVTKRADIETASAIFVELMKSMYVMMISVAAVIFCAVMYLMLNVMVERAYFGISLVKIFGYRTGEIKKLYLNGNTLIVTVGAIVAIPVAKLLMDKIFPNFIANTACGINLKFPWYLYGVIFVGILVCYFVIHTILVQKLKRISPAEVLKNRE